MNSNPSSERHDPEKGTAERRVKSVNFTDLDVFDFAIRRAESLYGGNFSAYVLALIERDRSLGESRRLLHDLERQILELVKPYGGDVAEDSSGPYDFAVPSLNLLIEAHSRFPRERQLEYRLLNSLQKVSLTMPGKHIALVYPENLPLPERERFRQFESVGIEGLRVCDTAELKQFLSALADPNVAELEASLRAQEQDDAALRAASKRSV